MGLRGARFRAGDAYRARSFPGQFLGSLPAETALEAAA